MNSTNWFPVLTLSFCLGASSLHAQATSLRLINDNYDSTTGANEDLYVLFVGAPAIVTSNGVGISGVRNLNLVQGSVTQNSVAGTGTPTSLTLTIAPPSQTPPATPFPILFNTQNEQYKVTNYNSTAQTITIVQDTSVSNSAWPPATTLVGTQNLYFQAGDTFTFGAYSQKFSSLNNTGQLSSPSEFSGKMPNVYEATANLTSGVIYFSEQPLTYIGSVAPSQTSSTIPFQPVELTSGASYASSDLTNINNFFLPMAIESVDSSGNVLDGRYFYRNQATINAELKTVGAPKGTSGMYLGPSSVDWSTGGSTFTSFEPYLASVNNTTFDVVSSNAGVTNPSPMVIYGVQAAEYNATYAYQASIKANTTAVGGYDITLTPDSSLGTNTVTNLTSPYYPLPAEVTDIVIHLPKAKINEYIYGAVLNFDSFTINMTSGSPEPLVPSGPFTVSGTGATTTSFQSQIGYLSTSTFTNVIQAFPTGVVAWFPNGGTPYHANITGMSANGDTMTITTQSLSQAPATSDQFLIAFEAQGFDGATNMLNLPQLQTSMLNVLPPFKVTFLDGSVSPSTVFAMPGVDGNYPLAANNNGKPGGPVTFTTPPSGDAIVQIIVDPQDVYTQLFTNSSYSAAVADVLAGFNFGFIGTTPDNSFIWYGSFPQVFPFGVAQPSNPYYNPWAAIFYNASDAYGFAFSDRVDPSPLLETDTGDQLWIWNLFSGQLNSPIVTATPSASSITLTWDAPDTATSYDITTTPGGQVPSPNITYTGTGENRKASYTYSNPIAGVTYQFDVVATKGGLTSLALPAYATALGAPAQITMASGGFDASTIAPTWTTTQAYQPGYAIFQISWSWFETTTDFNTFTGTPPSGFTNGVYDLYINQDKLTPGNIANGSLVAPSVNATVYAGVGTNNYVFQVKDRSTGDVIYSWLMQIDVASISQPSGVGDTGTYILSQTYPSASGNAQYAAIVYGNPSNLMLVSPTGSPPNFNIQAQSAEPNWPVTMQPIARKEFGKLTFGEQQQNQPVDKRPPVVSVERQRLFTPHSGPSVSINGFAMDDSSISHVEYSTDNGNVWTNGLLVGGYLDPIGFAARRQYVRHNWRIDLPDLAPGRSLVQIRAVDGEGNRSRPVIYGVDLLDRDAPRISLDDVDIQSLRNSARFTFTGKAYDEGQIASVEASMDGGQTWSRARLKRASPFLARGNTQDVVEWTYVWRMQEGQPINNALFRVTDRDGNAGEPFVVPL